MRYLISSILIIVTACLVQAGTVENVTLYNDNGRGGISQTRAQLVVDEGQYYVDFDENLEGIRTQRRHIKVYRVHDNVELWLAQPKWAEKYTYVAYEGGGLFQKQYFYYFNMRSPWRPSLTDDMNSSTAIKPLAKLEVYRDDWNGGWTSMTVIYVKQGGNYYLATGSQCYDVLYYVRLNDTNDTSLPYWARQYKYYSTISGLTYYFNVNNNHKPVMSR